MKLFAAKGYDQVTVEEIARAAGVSHMTFFRYFPTKVSVLLDDPYDPVIGAIVARTDPALPALARVRRGLLDAFGSLEPPDDALTRTRVRILAQHPELLAQAWANNRRTEQVIVDALTETGVAVLEARVAAGAAMGAMMAALIDWAQHEDAGSLAERVRRALELLAAGEESDG